MPTAITVVASDLATRDRLAALVPIDGFMVATCGPEELPSALPNLYVIALPAIETPEEQVIEHLRAGSRPSRSRLLSPAPCPWSIYNRFRMPATGRSLLSRSR